MTEINLEVSPKTIYTDIVDLPDPMLLGVTLRYYNHSDSALYMKITVSGANWSSNSQELGSLVSGSNAYYNWDNASSRTKPAAETTETLTFLLEGYSDSGYTTLVYSFSRNVTVIMIKSDDGSWTEDESDDFDDGTVQGWAVHDESGSGAALSLAADYVLSAPYSIKATLPNNISSLLTRLYKEFTTPDRATVYAIINVRTTQGWAGHRAKYVKLNEDATVLIHIGRAPDGIAEHYIPLNKWMRIVAPLTRASTLEVRIRVFYFAQSTSQTPKACFWLDDFKIISKA